MCVSPSAIWSPVRGYGEQHESGLPTCQQEMQSNAARPNEGACIGIATLSESTSPCQTKAFFPLKICRRRCRFSSSNASSWSLNQLGSLHNCSAASTHKQHTNSSVETQILLLTPVVSLAVGHSQRSTFACQPLSPHHALQLCMDQGKTSF